MKVYVNPPTKIKTDDGEFEIAFCTAHDPKSPNNVFIYQNEAGEDISEEEYYTLYPNKYYNTKKGDY